MQTKFISHPVQTWNTVGIPARHRAIIRRTVQSRLNVMSATMSVKWKSDDQELDAFLTGRGDFTQSSVLLVQLDLARMPFLQHDSMERTLNRETSPFQSIRLLWNWSAVGRRDLVWCTELGFVGVVSDIHSLESWVHVALERAHRSAIDDESFTSGISIPPL